MAFTPSARSGQQRGAQEAPAYCTTCGAPTEDRPFIQDFTWVHCSRPDRGHADDPLGVSIKGKFYPPEAYDIETDYHINEGQEFAFSSVALRDSGILYASAYSVPTGTCARMGVD